MSPPQDIGDQALLGVAGTPAAGGSAWEFIDSQILGSNGTTMEVHFDSAINFSDVQSFAIYMSASLNQSPSYQDASLRFGTGGTVISSGDYEAFGVVIQDGNQGVRQIPGSGLLNTSYGETSFRTETSNLGGTWISLTYLTMDPITSKPHMVMTVASDNRQTDSTREMAMLSCGGVIDTTLTSLQDITMTSGNSFLAGSRMYVYKVLST